MLWFVSLSLNSPQGEYTSASASVRHRINDVIDPVPIRERGHRLRVIRHIRELPGIAHIGIEIHGDHHPIPGVVHRKPRGTRAFRLDYLNRSTGAAPQMA